MLTTENLTLLTPAELKAKLQISTRTYTRMLAGKRLPFRLIGTRKRFVWSEVLASLPSGPEPTTQPAPGQAVDLVGYLKRKARGAHTNRRIS